MGRSTALRPWRKSLRVNGRLAPRSRSSQSFTPRRRSCSILRSLWQPRTLNRWRISGDGLLNCLAPRLHLRIRLEHRGDAERVPGTVGPPTSQRRLHAETRGHTREGRGHPDLLVTTKALEGTPRDVIVQEAADWKADLIVLGSHGHGRVRQALLGSVATGVAADAVCAVEIIRAGRRSITATDRERDLTLKS